MEVGDPIIFGGGFKVRSSWLFLFKLQKEAFLETFDRFINKSLLVMKLEIYLSIGLKGDGLPILQVTSLLMM